MVVSWQNTGAEYVQKIVRLERLDGLKKFIKSDFRYEVEAESYERRQSMMFRKIKKFRNIRK